MSDRAARYQEQITGQPADQSYVVTTDNGQKVKFDGYESGKYREAKGPGYENFVSKKNDKFYPWFDGADGLVEQARRQASAANGTPVVGTFAEQRAADAFEKRLSKEGIDGIIAKVDPSKKG